MASEKPLILVTNDDGITSSGIQELAKAMSRLGDVAVVAPDREMSATSQSLTLNHPLRFREVQANRFAVEGTPADCVILATFRILKRAPALLVSGVNRGANVGDDISYSGTVAAAMEGAAQNIPSIAVSASVDGEPDFKAAAAFAVKIARPVLTHGLPPGIILNLNYPSHWNGRVRLTHQGRKAGKTVLVENLDPRGREYFWLHEELHKPVEGEVAEILSDYDAIHSGFASLTPLQVDRTAEQWMKHFERWLEGLE